MQWMNLFHKGGDLDLEGVHPTSMSQEVSKMLVSGL